MISYWSVVLTFWISSITSKISWIFCWPWSNQVCLCVSVHLCLSVIDSTNWYMGGKNKCWYFLSGKVMEKSWNFFLRFLWEPWITRLAWTTWTPMSAVPKRLLNLITHSLAAIFESSHYLNHYLLYWGLLMELLSWYPIYKSSHCNSFEDGAPVDFIDGCPTFKWVLKTWPHGLGGVSI